MTVAYDQYKELTQQLNEGRERGTLGEAQEDALLDQMDDAWWAMTEAERESGVTIARK